MSPFCFRERTDAEDANRGMLQYLEGNPLGCILLTAGAYLSIGMHRRQCNRCLPPLSLCVFFLLYTVLGTLSQESELVLFITKASAEYETNFLWRSIIGMLTSRAVALRVLCTIAYTTTASLRTNILLLLLLHLRKHT